MLFYHSGWRILSVYRSDVVIMIIAVKECLYTVSSKEERVLFHLFLVVVFPVAVCVLRIKVVLIWWNEWRGYLPIVKIVPWEILEPNMFFDFLRSIQPQSVDRFPLNELVYEVSSL